MTRENAADILCIGAQRTMTSWLHGLMAAHPDAAAFPNFEPVTSTSKEAHYWDWNHRRGPDWYKVLTRPLDDAKKSLDFTPEYAFLTPEHIRECQALNPTAKVVYMLRDPLARAVSAVRMHTMWATGSKPADQHRIVFDEHFRKRCENARLRQHSDYAANIARWRSAYPDMVVTSYETLRADPVAEGFSLLDACGLATDTLDEAQRETLEARAKRKVWAVTRYELDADCLHYLAGLVWPMREACARELGLHFTEGDALLKGAHA